MARAEKRKRSSGSLDIAQQETFKATPAISPQARIRDQFYPDLGAASKSAQFGKALGLITEMASEAQPLIDRERKDAFVEGQLAANRGEDAPEGGALSNILGVQKARVRGYDITKAKQDKIKLSIDLQGLLDQATKNNFELSSEDFHKQVDQVFSDYADSFVDSADYLNEFAEVGASLVADTKLKHNQLLDKHNAGVMIESTTFTARGKIHEAIQEQTGFNIHSAATSTEARKAIRDLVNKPDFFKFVRGLITENQTDLLNGKFTVTRNDVSKAMVHMVGQLASSTGLPELMEGLLEEHEGVAAASADPLAFDRYRAAAYNKAEQLANNLEDDEEEALQDKRIEYVNGINAEATSIVPSLMEMAKRDPEGARNKAVEFELEIRARLADDIDDGEILDKSTTDLVDAIIRSVHSVTSSSIKQQQDPNAYKAFLLAYNDGVSLKDLRKILVDGAPSYSASEMSQALSFLDRKKRGDTAKDSQIFTDLSVGFTSEVSALQHRINGLSSKIVNVVGGEDIPLPSINIKNGAMNELNAWYGQTILERSNNPAFKDNARPTNEEYQAKAKEVLSKWKDIAKSHEVAIKELSDAGTSESLLNFGEIDNPQGFIKRVTDIAVRLGDGDIAPDDMDRLIDLRDNSKLFEGATDSEIDADWQDFMSDIGLTPEEVQMVSQRRRLGEAATSITTAVDPTQVAEVREEEFENFSFLGEFLGATSENFKKMAGEIFLADSLLASGIRVLGPPHYIQPLVPTQYRKVIRTIEGKQEVPTEGMEAFLSDVNALLGPEARKELPNANMAAKLILARDAANTIIHYTSMSGQKPDSAEQKILDFVEQNQDRLNALQRAASQVDTKRRANEAAAGEAQSEARRQEFIEQGGAVGAAGRGLRRVGAGMKAIIKMLQADKQEVEARYEPRD